MSLIPRTSYIGGSDAASILGLHQYKSRRAVWELKRGIIPDMDLSANPHVLRGETIEPIVERWIRDNLDPTINDKKAWKKHNYDLAERRIPVREPDQQIMLMDKMVHPSTGLPFIGGHPDGIGSSGILYEIKAPTTYKLDRITKDGLPSEWLYQVQHYLMIAKLQLAKMVIWNSDAWEPVVLPIYADLDLHELMREAYVAFWQHVLDGTEPLDGTDTIDHQVTVLPDAEIERMLREYKLHYNRRYTAEDRQKVLRMQILTAAQGRKTLITPKYTAKIDLVKMWGKDVTRLTITENQQPNV